MVYKHAYQEWNVMIFKMAFGMQWLLINYIKDKIIN